MDKLKNIFNNCNDLESAYLSKQKELKNLLEKNKESIKSNQSVDTKKLKNLIEKAKKHILTNKQLDQMRTEQNDIMNSFYKIDKTNVYKRESQVPEVHKHITHVSPIQIVKVDKNNNVEKTDDNKSMSNNLRQKIDNMVEAKKKELNNYTFDKSKQLNKLAQKSSYAKETPSYKKNESNKITEQDQFTNEQYRKYQERKEQDLERNEQDRKNRERKAREKKDLNRKAIEKKDQERKDKQKEEKSEDINSKEIKHKKRNKNKTQKKEQKERVKKKKNKKSKLKSRGPETKKKVKTKNKLGISKKVCSKNNIEQYLSQKGLIDTEINTNQKKPNISENQNASKNKLNSKKKNKNRRNKKRNTEELDLDKLNLFMNKGRTNQTDKKLTLYLNK